ncbi:MAG: adenosylcobinamide-GDP ribazoletransferase, partial [Bacteroidaceae bacterium]|nr:adenosylcobinamide-GDP ribazoletransferase [Bacteroidaceae bacterium]
LVWREASVVGVVMAAAALWLLVTWMRRRLAGYTGDCCGATFLVVELVFFVTLLTERCMR